MIRGKHQTKNLNKTHGENIKTNKQVLIVSSDTQKMYIHIEFVCLQIIVHIISQYIRMKHLKNISVEKAIL